MPDDLGVWTADDCALVLIDYQNEMFEVILSRVSPDQAAHPATSANTQPRCEVD